MTRPCSPSRAQPRKSAQSGTSFRPRNPAALAAYYTGIFSLIPGLGAVLGPIALILGIKGLKAVPTVPGQVGKVHAWIGIVLGAITSLANWLMIALMVVVATVA